MNFRGFSSRRQVWAFRCIKSDGIIHKVIVLLHKTMCVLLLYYNRLRKIALYMDSAENTIRFVISTSKKCENVETLVKNNEI